MATSGTLYNTFDNGRTVARFEWVVESQDYVTWTSTIYWKLSICRYTGSNFYSTTGLSVYHIYDLNDQSVELEFGSYPDKIEIDSQYHTVKEGRLDIKHDAEGEGRLSILVNLITNLIISDKYVNIEVDESLPPLPGNSTLTVDGIRELGRLQTITITPKVPDGATHILEYGVLKSKNTFEITPIGYLLGINVGTTENEKYNPVSTTSLTWTPDLSLANYSPRKSTMTLAFTLTTYYKGEQLGEGRVTTIDYDIPANVAPSVRIDVTDLKGCPEKYGGYVQSISELSINLVPTLAYDSAVRVYSLRLNEQEYSKKQLTTTMKTSDPVTVSATVTDFRGRQSGTASRVLTFLPYAQPIVRDLQVHRCNPDGTANESGGYVRVNFRSIISPLNDKNSAKYLLRYKKTTESEYTAFDISRYDGLFNIEGGVIFTADTGSSYDVELWATDDFYTTKRATTASTAFTLMHWNTEGNGLAVGKVAELPNLFDVGLPSRFREPVQFDDQVIFAGTNKVLWSGEDDLTVGVFLSDTVSKQLNGIVLIFGLYHEGKPYNSLAFFVPKEGIEPGNTSGRAYNFVLATECFADMGTKYATIYDNQIVGRESNGAEGDSASGIHYNNGKFKLQAVLGV